MKSVQLCILAYVCFAISMVCFADESFNLESILESIPEEGESALYNAIALI